jgi:hypothetical protein
MADAAGGVEKSEALGRGLFARRDLLDICDVRGQAVGPVKRVIARILMNEMIRRISVIVIQVPPTRMAKASTNSAMPRRKVISER